MNRTERSDEKSKFPRQVDDFWSQLSEVSSTFRPADLIVFALIIGFGVLQFFYTDFLTDNVYPADTARSLVEHGFYGINGYAETNYPPGFVTMFALLCIVGGCSGIVFMRAMVVFGTFGFLASYELLRRQAPRAVAAATCLLLVSSEIYFTLVTRLLNQAFPYFFTTMSALLVTRKFESATTLRSRIGWGALLTGLILASLMFMSAGIALLSAIGASICALFVRNPRIGFARLRIYVAVLLVGIVAQEVWMRRDSPEASGGVAAQEWPIAGFPHSYLSQLRVKNGNYPELGMATPSDVVIRILRHASEQAGALSNALLRSSIAMTSFSVTVIVPLLLIVLGWCVCVWTTAGGLQDWYFAGYIFIYLVWPWDLEPRVPVAPLACLYIWHGGKAVALLAKNSPRILGVLWFPVAIPLAICSWVWVPKGLDKSGLHDWSSFVVWLTTAVLAAWMIRAGEGWLQPFSAFAQWFAAAARALRVSPRRIFQLLGLALVSILIFVGLAKQFRLGRENLDPGSLLNRPSAVVAAAEWIASHTEPAAIVMARNVPVVWHYTQRKLIWLPPSSNSQLLMDGIRRHKIDFVIVMRRENNPYWLPPDDACFDPLLAAHPDAFRLVNQASEFRIFQVARNATGAR